MRPPYNTLLTCSARQSILSVLLEEMRELVLRHKILPPLITVSTPVSAILPWQCNNELISVLLHCLMSVLGLPAHHISDGVLWPRAISELNQKCSKNEPKKWERGPWAAASIHKLYIQQVTLTWKSIWSQSVNKALSLTSTPKHFH